MAHGILDSYIPGYSEFRQAGADRQEREAHGLRQRLGILNAEALQQQTAEAAQTGPLNRQLLEAKLNAAKNPQPVMKDLGGSIGLFHPTTGALLGQIPKSATPDAALREQGADRRHVTPSGSAALGAEVSIRGQDITDNRARWTHQTPSGSAQLGANVSVRGQDLTNARALEQASRDRFGAPLEVTGPDGPRFAVQNRNTGGLVDPETKQPLSNVGPKMGESAQKQQTGVDTTQGAIAEYRNALRGWSATDIANPNARARIGTIYNNMLLQAKEAYNLGVLNGPDYAILQEVITNPASWTGAMTSKKALDDQASKLDELLGKVGSSVVKTQSGQDRRSTPRTTSTRVVVDY